MPDPPELLAPEDADPRFGAILQGLLDNRGLTPNLVAVGATRSPSTIHLLISGRLPPSEKVLRHVAPVLQMPLADLLVIAGIPVDPPETPPPPYPQTPGIHALIHAATGLTSEQLKQLADRAVELREENARLSRDFPLA
jgi:transcriptional regulator with XRE-family HTH domain